MKTPPTIAADKIAKYATDPAAFRDDLIVEVDGVMRRFGDVMDPWQSEDFERIDPALMECNGRVPTDTETVRNYWLERARGHSKTTDLAVICCWALAFATRLVRGYAFAADRDQAGLLKDAMDRVVRLNPWLQRVLAVQKSAVVNIKEGHPGEGSTLQIFTSDVGSSYGILPDFVICDEIVHWQSGEDLKDGEGQLWHSIVSSAAKRKSCMLVVITNSGFKETWQWGTRETARTDPAWHFSRLDGPKASWMTEKRLAEQRRMLPGLAFNRLFLNEWSTGLGDALTEEAINRAFADGLKPMTGMEDGFSFVAGLDLGLTRDGSAVAVLAVPNDGSAGKIRLAHLKLWRPPVGGKIDLLEVEKHILDLNEIFGLQGVAFDPWQAEHMAQSIEADTDKYRRNQRKYDWSEPFMREIPPTPTNLRNIASLTIEFFNDRRVLLYDCPSLRRDLHKLRCEEKSYGVRLISPRDGEGHGDSFSAFALALLIAHESAGKRPVVLGDEPDYHQAFNQRLQEYHQEQREMNARDDDPTGFRAAFESGDFNVIGNDNPFFQE